MGACPTLINFSVMKGYTHAFYFCDYGNPNRMIMERDQGKGNESQSIPSVYFAVYCS